MTKIRGSIMTTVFAPHVQFVVPLFTLINDKNKRKHYDHVNCSACAVWNGTPHAY